MNEQCPCMNSNMFIILHLNSQNMQKLYYKKKREGRRYWLVLGLIPDTGAIVVTTSGRNDDGASDGGCFSSLSVVSLDLRVFLFLLSFPYLSFSLLLFLSPLFFLALINSRYLGSSSFILSFLFSLYQVPISFFFLSLLNQAYSHLQAQILFLFFISRHYLYLTWLPLFHLPLYLQAIMKLLEPFLVK